MIIYTLFQLSYAARPIYIISEDDVANYDLILEDLIAQEEYSQGVDIFIKGQEGLISADDYFVPFEQPPKDEHPEVVLPSTPNYKFQIDLLSNKGVDLHGETSGVLSGKAIHISQCHGWMYFDSLGSFTQRGVHFSTVEDFHNPEGSNQFSFNTWKMLVLKYLQFAREITTPTKISQIMMVLDTPKREVGLQMDRSALQREVHIPMGKTLELGTTRVFSATGGGIATWIPDVPRSGYYNVYVSWDSEPDTSSMAHYRIHHKGGIIDRYFDQRIHGSTWQYAERLWLEQGVDSLKIELIGDSGEPGSNVIADAVRIGGGMEDVYFNGMTTQRPRWESAALYYTQYNGAPTSIYGTSSSDPASRSKWAAWEHPSTEDAVYLSWHSNACGTGDECSARGTSTHHYNNTSSTQTYAQYVQDALVDALGKNWDSTWNDRGVVENNFAEVNPSYNAEMPSILVEMAFHNNEIDAGYLKEPLFRKDASKSYGSWDY